MAHEGSRSRFWCCQCGGAVFVCCALVGASNHDVRRWHNAGYLNRLEAKAVMIGVGLRMTDDELDTAFDDMDQDGARRKMLCCSRLLVARPSIFPWPAA